TGAMYRAVGLAALERGVGLEDDAALAGLVEKLEIDLRPGPEGLRCYLNGADISDKIRSDEVSQAASRVSARPVVREALVRRQRALGRSQGAVMEGRDIGTVVFPDADLKVFLTASITERARRRRDQLAAQGADAELETTLDEIRRRDARDSTRAHAPLVKAPGAVEIDATALSIEEVVERVLSCLDGRQ
ncbi:MAG: (d)CMP kinase, partial [Myxococcales bacterium]|nr:(d)CMP kinase [Myxococcales bacterium]